MGHELTGGDTAGQALAEFVLHVQGAAQQLVHTAQPQILAQGIQHVQGLVLIGHVPRLVGGEQGHVHLGQKGRAVVLFHGVGHGAERFFRAGRKAGRQQAAGQGERRQQQGSAIFAHRILHAGNDFWATYKIAQTPVVAKRSPRRNGRETGAFFPSRLLLASPPADRAIPAGRDTKPLATAVPLRGGQAEAV